MEQINIQPQYRLHNTGIYSPNSTIIIRKLNLWLKSSEMLETCAKIRETGLI